MRNTNALGMIVITLALLATGCDSKNKGKIEGTHWTSNSIQVSGKTFPAGALMLYFANDGNLIYTIGGEAHPGKYTLGMGETVKLNMDQPLGGKTDHSETVTIVGDQLTMKDSDGTAITFLRVKN